MEYFTVRNTVILALTRVGVIVAGVLSAGAVVFSMSLANNPDVIDPRGEHAVQHRQHEQRL